MSIDYNFATLEHVRKPRILLQSHNFGSSAQRLELAISTDMPRSPPGHFAQNSAISLRKKVSEHALVIMHKKLNVGCGTNIRAGWINLDSAKLPGIDFVHDIEKLPLPFADGEFEEVLCQDVLEHTEYIPILKDLHRILRPGGIITVRVPHFTSKNNYIDPTHKRRFSVSTFDFFIKNSRLKKERDYYFDFSFSSIHERRITFERSSRIFFYNHFVEWLANRNSRMQELYESTFLSRLFPAENIIITLVK